MKQFEEMNTARDPDDAIRDLVTLWTEVVDRLHDLRLKEGSSRSSLLLGLLLNEFDRRLLALADSNDAPSISGEEIVRHGAQPDDMALGTGYPGASGAGAAIGDGAWARNFTAAEVRELILIACI